MGEAIAITSGKGGVGKSSSIISIASMLADKGYRVLMIDMDLGLKNLDIMMGLQHRVIYDLKDVLEGKCTLSKAILKDKKQDNLFLLPACKSVHIENFPKERLPLVISRLKEEYDYLLFDTPAGMESGFLHTLAHVRKWIIVTTADVTALQDADKMIGILMREGIDDISFVLNRVRIHMMEKGESVSIEDAKSWLCVPFLGYVSENEAVIKANNHGLPLVQQEKNEIYHCYDCITRRLLGEHVPLPALKREGFFHRLWKR